MRDSLQSVSIGVSGVVVCTGMCGSAFGGMFEYGGLEYATVDWISVSSGTEVAVGNAGGIGVTLETMDILTDSIGVYDFSTDPAFDALSYTDGAADSISVFGGVVGTSRLSFDTEIGSVLFLFGVPGVDTDQTQFGASVWDFDDSLGLSVIDGEGEPGFEIHSGNRLLNPSWGPDTQAGGVVGINGGMTELVWEQGTDNAGDRMQITIAIAVPAPMGCLVLSLPTVLCVRRRR